MAFLKDEVEVEVDVEDIVVEEESTTEETTEEAKDVTEEEKTESKTNYIIVPTGGPAAEADVKIRVIGLVGDLDEEKASEIMYGMLALHKTGQKERLVEPDNPECIETEPYIEPFEFIISTHGGSASDMFGIYDLMRKMKSEGVEIQTYGLGKVMSAGVLLLASGSKGKRRIGANCRVMVHSVIGGSSGAIHNLENEMDEIRWIQEQYINRMVEETAMTKKYLMNLLKKKVNVYISAQEAVDLGIADEVI